MITRSKIRGRVRHVECPDHAALPEMAHSWVSGHFRQNPCKFDGFGPVSGNHLVVFEDIQYRQCRAAGEWVAGVGMRMQETARGGVVVKRGVNLIRCQHCRQWHIAASDAFGQANEIGTDGSLLASEQASRATETDSNFVRYQVHPIAVAQLARARQIRRVIHRHARRALHQRLDDESCDGIRMVGQMGFQRVGAALRKGLGGFARLGQPRVGGGYLYRMPQQRRVGRLEQRDVGHRQCADGFAVVAVLETDKAVLLWPACITPVVGAHF